MSAVELDGFDFARGCAYMVGRWFGYMTDAQLVVERARVEEHAATDERAGFALVLLDEEIADRGARG